MKTIGLIGGTSWESTVTYYQEINTLVKQWLGGLHSGKIALYSVDFAEYEAAMSAGDWDKVARDLIGCGHRLQAAGADFVLICTNTMHMVADEVQAGIGVPLLHIAHATAAALRAQGIQKTALLGTKYTMEQNFYKDALQQAGIEVLVPPQPDRERLNSIVFDELCLGRFLPASRQYLLGLIDTLAQQGAQGVVLGCTEIPLLIQQQDSPLPLFDTARIHAAAAVELAFATSEKDNG